MTKTSLAQGNGVNSKVPIQELILLRCSLLTSDGIGCLPVMSSEEEYQ